MEIIVHDEASSLVGLSAAPHRSADITHGIRKTLISKWAFHVFPSNGRGIIEKSRELFGERGAAAARFICRVIWEGVMHDEYHFLLLMLALCFSVVYCAGYVLMKSYLIPYLHICKIGGGGVAGLKLMKASTWIGNVVAWLAKRVATSAAAMVGAFVIVFYGVILLQGNTAEDVLSIFSDAPISSMSAFDSDVVVGFMSSRTQILEEIESF